MPRKISPDAAKRLAARASVSGGKLSPTRYELKVSGVCTSPKPLVMESERTKHMPSLQITLRVRCNSCDLCLWSRRKAWTERMDAELAKAPRTWYFTGTWRPAARQLVYLAASSRDETERTKTMMKWALKEFRGFAKRIREGTRPRRKFRYIVVIELHKDGFPHVHALLHELEGVPLKKEFIRGKWKVGNTKCVLYSPEQNDGDIGSYLAKYLGKELSIIRASQYYGASAPIPDPVIPPWGDRGKGLHPKAEILFRTSDLPHDLTSQSLRDAYVSQLVSCANDNRLHKDDQNGERLD